MMNKFQESKEYYNRIVTMSNVDLYKLRRHALSNNPEMRKKSYRATSVVRSLQTMIAVLLIMVITENGIKLDWYYSILLTAVVISTISFKLSIAICMVVSCSREFKMSPISIADQNLFSKATSRLLKIDCAIVVSFQSLLTYATFLGGAYLITK